MGLADEWRGHSSSKESMNGEEDVILYIVRQYTLSTNGSLRIHQKLSWQVSSLPLTPTIIDEGGVKEVKLITQAFCYSH